MIVAACRSWLKHLFIAPREKRAIVLRRTHPLRLEPLEDRMLLSTFLDLNGCNTPVNAPPVVVLNNQGALPVVNTGHDLSLSGSFTDPDSHHWTATVNYGDGSAVQPLVLAPDHTFTFDHVYQNEGNYFLTVTITDGRGASGFVSVPVLAYNTGVDIGQIGQGTAPPGSSVNISAPGITATLQRNGADLASVYAVLLVAPVADSEIDQLNGGSFPFLPGTPISAYDVRSINLTAQDKAVVTFQYPASPGMPTLQYFDPVSHSFQPVLGSALQVDSIVIDPEQRTITLTFDASSTPRLSDLTGTVFVVSVSQDLNTLPGQPPPSPVPPSPPANVSSSPATESTIIGMGGLGGSPSATAGTTPSPSTSLLMALQSGTPSALASSGGAQLASNSLSANGISAFSPFFVLIITAARPSVSESEAEAGGGAGAEPSAATTPPSNVPSLLNRLPRVPVSEENFTPPDSGPNAVLSPSRAGPPEETDRPNPRPAPLPSSTNGAPPVGLRFQPADIRPNESLFGAELLPILPSLLPRAAVSKNAAEENADWFDGVLVEILERLSWNDREREDASVHPAIAVLVLCAGLVRRTPKPPLRNGERLRRGIAE